VRVTARLVIALVIARGNLDIVDVLFQCVRYLSLVLLVPYSLLEIRIGLP
jgi:hypothetical protein